MIAEYIAGWSLLAFVFLLIGLGLLIFEMFVPGFGVAGVLGILSLIAAIALRADSLQSGLLTAAVIFVALIIAAALFFRSAAHGRVSRSAMILKEREHIESVHKELSAYIGQTGIAVNMLRPSGHADFDGIRLDVMTSGEVVEKGKKICVERITGNKIIVREIKADVPKEGIPV
jgi:membrane-bound ClpP family serine protease